MNLEIQGIGQQWLKGESMSKFVMKLHERVKNQIENQTKVYSTKGNRGRKELVLNEGDWVWLHLRKDRFPTKRKSKLSPRGDGPFHVLERINNNAYRLDLPEEYGVSTTFNIFDLIPFAGGADIEDEKLTDLRSNPLQGGGCFLMQSYPQGHWIKDSKKIEL